MPMNRYAWLEFTDGMWHFITNLFEDPGNATRRWLKRQSAMEELKQTRLMTLDEAQAKAAEALGHDVVRPGRD